MARSNGGHITTTAGGGQADPAGRHLAGVAALLGVAAAASYADAHACLRAIAPPPPGRLPAAHAPPPLARAQNIAWGGGWLQVGRSGAALAAHPAAGWSGRHSWALRLGAALTMAQAARLSDHHLTRALAAASLWHEWGFVLTDRGLARDVAELDWLGFASVVDGARALALDKLFAGALVRALSGAVMPEPAVSDRQLFDYVLAQARRSSEVAMLLYWVDPKTRFVVAGAKADGMHVHPSIPPLDPLVGERGTILPLSQLCPRHAETVAEVTAALDVPFKVAIRP
jgi:hypothetical protein